MQDAKPCLDCFTAPSYKRVIPVYEVGVAVKVSKDAKIRNRYNQVLHLDLSDLIVSVANQGANPEERFSRVVAQFIV